MDRKEYIRLTAVQLAEMIRKKHYSPEEVLQACEDAVEEMNPVLNVIYYQNFQNIKKQLMRGIDLEAPFAGVPILVKDSGGMVKGLPYSAGSRLIDGTICREDSGLAKRLKKAGFLIVGSTNTPELCFTNTTESILHGPSHNPWNLNYSTGGSSGGSAAAVACGMVPFAHGSDGGGSIREPASCCGVVGFKPSRFRITGAPASDDSLSGLCAAFGLTRSVNDVRSILKAVEGMDAGFYGTELPLGSHRVKSKLRIAVMRHYPLGGEMEDTECLEKLDEAAALLRICGCEVEEDYPAVDAGIHWARTTIQSAYIVCQLDDAARKTGRPITEDYVERMILTVYQRGKQVTGEEFVRALEINNQISRSVGCFMEKYDLILCPTMGKLPPKLGIIDSNVHPEWNYEKWTEEKSRYTHFTNLFNATGQPSISIPLFTSKNGLPIGMELSGRIGEDETVLAVAEMLEQMKPWIDRIPDITRHFCRN